MDPKPAEQARRGLKRLDELVNLLHQWQNLLYTNVKIVDARTVGGELVLSYCNEAQQDQFWPPNVSIDDARSFLAQNKCVASLQTLAPMVAYLTNALPKPPRVREINLEGVRATKRVTLVDSEGEAVKKVAHWHAMFEIRDESDSWFLDPSADQYGRVPGMTRVSEYPVEPGKKATWDPLGSAYDDMEGKIHDAHVRNSDGFRDLRYLIIAISGRFVDNSVYEVLKAHGGATILWRAEDKEWANVFREIMEVVGQELGPIYNKIVEIRNEHKTSEAAAMAKARAVAESQMKEGHREFVKALPHHRPTTPPVALCT